MVKRVVSVAICCGLSTLVSWAQSTQYTYDSLNRLTRVTYPSGTTVTYTYDASGNRLTQLTANSSIPLPSIGVDKPTLTFTAYVGQSDPSPQSVTISNSGGGTLNWTATPADNWVRIDPVQGANTGSITISPSIAGRSAGTYNSTISINSPGAANAPRNITVNLTVSACAFTLNPPSVATVSAAGASGSINVAGPSSCSAAVSSNVSWIALTSGASVNGGGLVSYSVAANTVAPRSGTITIAGQVFTINQAGPSTCTYNVVPRAIRLSAPGETRPIYVQATGGGCSWDALVGGGFLSTSVSGSTTGNGTVNVTAMANTGAVRTGSVTIAGTTVVVEQVAACAATLSPNQVNMPNDGGAQMITVGATCDWNVSHSATWVHALKFSGIVQVIVDPNFAPRARSATVHIGSQVLIVAQAASMQTETERLTRLLFYQLLGRGPTVQDIQFWGSQLTANRGATAHALFIATETAFRSRYVNTLYRGFLNRAPEQGGWLFQRNVLASLDSQGNPAGARDDLINNFITSAEFRLLFGAPTNAEFVRIVYRQMLGREPSQAEVDWQVSMMTGPNPQVVMARNTLLTPEVIGRFEAGAVALLIYHALLLREPHPAEIASTEALLAGGTVLSQIIADVTASSEFEAYYK